MIMTKEEQREALRQEIIYWTVQAIREARAVLGHEDTVDYLKGIGEDDMAESEALLLEEARKNLEWYKKNIIETSFSIHGIPNS